MKKINSVKLKVSQTMFLRILAYFVPFAINFLTGGFFFITSYRFAQANCPALIVGGAVAAWGIAYCLITMFVGKITRPGNALHLILAGGLMLTLTSVGFIVFFNMLYSQFIFLLMSGCGAALFCTPFQLLARNIESASPRKTSGAVSAASFYTFTWSVGFASGPLAFARLAPRTGFFVTLALALAVTLSVICIAIILRKKTPTATEVIEDNSNSAKQPEFSEQTFNKLAILGWIGGSVCTLAVCQIRSMWSKLGGELEFYVYDNGWVSITTKIPARRWSFVTAVRDGEGLKLYVDGVLAAERAYTGSVMANGVAPGVGVDLQSNRDFRGLMAGIQIYSRALDAEEIAGLNPNSVADGAVVGYDFGGSGR
jgi:MFS family permease